MMRWLVTQLAQAALAAWATASLVFILSRLAGGGPAENLGQIADTSTVVAGANASDRVQDARLALNHRLGLDEPVFYVTRTSTTGSVKWHWHGWHNQYHHWVVGLLHGQLGISFRDGQPIGPRLRAALAYTVPLTSSAAVVAALSALGLGLLIASAPAASQAVNWRAGIELALSALQGIPLFALALALLFAFANPDVLAIFPIASLPTAATGSNWGESALQLVLPLVALVLVVLPELTLPLAAALRQELQADYALTARAKGVSTAQLLRRHALPNAVLPLLTSFTGLLPSLAAGTVVVEVVFAIPGMGRLLAEAAAASDYPLVVAGVLLTAASRLLALLLADILYAWVDPRIRSAA